MTKLCPNCEELLQTQGHCAGCGWTGPIQQGLHEPNLPAATPKMPYVSIDIETTGLDPETCQVLEIGAVVDDWTTPIDNLPWCRWTLNLRQIVGEPYALALNANLLKQIASKPIFSLLPEEVGCDLARWLTSKNLDPLHVQAAGKNFAGFDLQFLKRLPQFNEYVGFHRRILDPAMLFWRPSEDERLPDSKTCYARAGIDTHVAHTAVEDAFAVVRLIRIGTKRLEASYA